MAGWLVGCLAGWLLAACPAGWLACYAWLSGLLVGRCLVGWLAHWPAWLALGWLAAHWLAQKHGGACIVCETYKKGKTQQVPL